MKADNSKTGHPVFIRLVPWIVVFMALQSLLRLALLIANWWMADHQPLALIKVFLYGMAVDGAIFACMTVVPLLVWAAIPGIKKGKLADNILTTTLFTLFVFTWFFIAVAEWIFFKEFGRRFFFIIYQYLSYGGEVLASIRESYPVAGILFFLTVATAVTVFVARPWRVVAWANKKRWEKVAGSFFLLLVFLLFVCITGVLRPDFTREANAEISKNGYLTAFLNRNFLIMSKDSRYSKDYVTENNAGQILRREISPEGGRYLSAHPADIGRRIKGSGRPIFPNVIVIMMESMDASNMAFFGNKEGLTPNLDALSPQSIFFTDLYSIGHGTVYGLQAVTLSTPVIGVEPILLSPDNGNLYTVGNIFHQRGYDTAFIYGGDTRFGNLKTFFGGNGYRVIDRHDFHPENKLFLNAWGSDDESELDEVITRAGQAVARHQRFFYHVMTMSNHPPYTYPEGRIDIPSGSDPSGGIKYADYAIGQFLKKARKTSWFDNTIFVFVADHCGYGRGFVTDNEDWQRLYRVPALIYAPKLLKPRQISQMTSQIDLPATLMGILGWDYVSYFTGKDALREKIGRSVFFLDDHSLVYMTQDKKATILQKGGKVRQLQDKTPLAMPDVAHKAKAIAYFQHASQWRSHLKRK